MVLGKSTRPQNILQRLRQQCDVHRWHRGRVQGKGRIQINSEVLPEKLGGWVTSLSWGLPEGDYPRVETRGLVTSPFPMPKAQRDCSLML